MTTPVTTGPRPQRGLLNAMDREWPALASSTAGRRARRRWTPRLASAGVDVDSLDGLVEVIRHPGDHTRSDVVARVLIGAAQAGDELAARTLMQGLVPFAGRLAGQYTRYGPVGADDVVAEVLAAVQLRIMRTRLDRRDGFLVAHLQLTVRRQLQRGDSARLLRARIGPVIEHLDPDRLDDVAQPGRRGGHGGEGAVTDQRTTADHVATIVTDGVRAGVLSLDDAELLLLAAAGNSAAAIGRWLQRDKSVISRRIRRAAVAAGRVAA